MKSGKATMSHVPNELLSFISVSVHSKTSSTIAALDVVTRGDSNPIRKYAKFSQLTCYKWPITADVVKEHNYDVGVVVSFGHMIPEDVINAFPLLVCQFTLNRL